MLIDSKRDWALALILFFLFVAGLAIAFDSPTIHEPWFFAGVAWAVIYGARLIFAVLVKRSDRVETKLARLLALGAAGITGSPASDIDWKTVRLACLKKMYKVNSYCSRTVVQDFDNNKLAARNFVLIQWRADFAGPDRWHVTQEGADYEHGGMWDESVGQGRGTQICEDDKGDALWDEWISIGKQNFQNSGLWYPVDDDLHADWNLKLSIEPLLKIVAEQTPHSIEFCEQRHCRYVVVRYSWAAVLSSIGYLLSDNGDAGVREAEQKEAMGDLEIWVDADKKDIVKCKFSENKGAGEISRFSQTFTCFDENIEVAAPLWLNAVPSQSGGLTVVDASVLRMPHHR